MRIEIVSDVICPWCFIGKRRLEKALAQRPDIAFEVGWRPFQLNPDPAFFFGSRGHKRAFAYLQYGVYQSEGFIVITGEIGAGKTTIVRSLFEQLDRTKLVAARTKLKKPKKAKSVTLKFKSRKKTYKVKAYATKTQLQMLLPAALPKGTYKVKLGGKTVKLKLTQPTG